MKTVHDYLKLYDQDCWLVYRPVGEGWSNRVKYKSEEYDKSIPYNHRSILDNEVVFDFDADNLVENEDSMLTTLFTLGQFRLQYRAWFSGNRGYHVHTFWNFSGITNIPLMKRTLLKLFTVEGSEIDMQLTGAHLIRAECGLNEKSGKYKTLITESPRPGYVNQIPNSILEIYNHKLRQKVARVYNKDSIAQHPDVQYFIKTHEFGAKPDGHERALYLLCQTLKNQWVDDKAGFIQHMQDWYHASGGKQLSDAEIARKVVYHLHHEYRITTHHFTQLREDINSL